MICCKGFKIFLNFTMDLFAVSMDSPPPSSRAPPLCILTSFLEEGRKWRVGPRSYFLLYILEANNSSNRKHLLMPIYSLWTSPAYEPALHLNGNSVDDTKSFWERARHKTHFKVRILFSPFNSSCFPPLSQQNT